MEQRLSETLICIRGGVVGLWRKVCIRRNRQKGRSRFALI